MNKNDQIEEDYREETEDYEVGYGKPPNSRQFKKGISGNPSGRPKKSSDFASELARELNAKLVINENGQRKVIKKSEGVAKQLVNKAVSGSIQATRLVVSLKQQAEESESERQRNSPDKPDYENVTVKDLSRKELLMVIQGIHPEYSKK
jgi:Family of unknown function (DUF5681)